MTYNPRNIAEGLLKNSQHQTNYDARLMIDTPMGGTSWIKMLLTSAEEPLEARYSIVSKTNRDKVLYLSGLLPAVWTYEAQIVNLGEYPTSDNRVKDFIIKEWLDGVAAGEIQAFYLSRGQKAGAKLTYLDQEVNGILGSLAVLETSENNKLATLKFSILIPRPDDLFTELT